jgi:hybrid cluster-associated redox disulfide protein
MKAKISSESLIEDLVKDHPATVKIFTRHKLPCIMCGEPLWGTVAENADRYGADLDALLKDLKKEVEAEKS